MISILSSSFRTATRLDHHNDGQKPVCRPERKRERDRKADAEVELRRWHQRWFAG